MARKTRDARPDPAKMRFEEATGELESIIERIEQGDLGLEESLAERRRGDELIKRSRAILDAAEQELDQTRVDEAGGGETSGGETSGDETRSEKDPPAEQTDAPAEPRAGSAD